jgi:integrase
MQGCCVDATSTGVGILGDDRLEGLNHSWAAVKVGVILLVGTPLMSRPYDLRHAAVSTWLNAGVPAAQVAEWAGHSVDVLLRVYIKCIAGQQGEAKRRIEDATRREENDLDPRPDGQAD